MEAVFRPNVHLGLCMIMVCGMVGLLPQTDAQVQHGFRQNEALSRLLDPTPMAQRLQGPRRRQDDRIVFPDNDDGSWLIKFPEPPTRHTPMGPIDQIRPSQPQLNRNEIPVSFFLNKSISSLRDFIDKLVINKDDFAADEDNTGQSNGTLLLRSNSGVSTDTIVPYARCEPQMTVVELERPSDPSTIYFPTCTRIERCGGCCMHDLLMCVPIQVEIVPIKVMQATYIPEEESFIQEGMKSLTLEKHIECSCNCRIKPEDCNALQEYHYNECRCTCTNLEDAAKCDGDNKSWDPVTCTCQCRNTQECSTSFFFDPKTCSCQSENGIPVRTPPPRFRMLEEIHDVVSESAPQVARLPILGSRRGVPVNTGRALN